MTEIRELLRDAARPPSEPLDVDALWRRRGRRRVAAAGGGVGVLLVAVAVAVVLYEPRPSVVLDSVPEEPAEGVLLPEGWQTITVGGAALSVPGDWPVTDVRMSGPIPRVDSIFRQGPAVYVADGLYQPPGPPLEPDPPPRHAGIYALPASADADPEQVLWLVEDGTPITVNGHEGRWTATEEFRWYLFADLDLLLWVSYDPDPDLMEQVLATLRLAEPDPGPPEPDVVPVTEIGDALVFGDDGIHVVEDGAMRQVWSEPVVEAFSDLAGGVAFQPASDGSDIWVLDAATWLAAAFVEDDGTGSLRLHGVFAIDDEPHVAYTRRTGEGDAEEEWLYLRPLTGDAERRMALTGRYESGLGALGYRDGVFAALRCHLDCFVQLLDPSGMELGELSRLHVAPLMVEAAAFTPAGALAYVSYDLDHDRTAYPLVGLTDLDASEAPRYVDLRLPDAHWAAAALDVLPSGNLVLSLRREPGGWVQPFLLDVTGEGPAIRRLDAEGAVRPR